MSGYRLQTGGIVDRSRPLGFTWAGRRMQGFAGDTLASALIANGASIIGRSFKYHRPRGLIAAGLEEPNGIVQIGSGARTLANLKATQVELFEGLEASPVNSWPSTEHDALGVIGLFKRFIPAAFYYKTFMWPNWHLFEPSIRKAAGLGRAPTQADPDRYEHRYAIVDTLVVGSGPAGLAAALEAAARGSVMLVESDAELGGTEIGDVRTRNAITSLRALSNVQLLPRTLAFGFYDHNLVGLNERLTDHLPPDMRKGPRERLWKVRAGHVVMATGAFERPMQFVNNDLPGVMLAGAAETYCRRFGVAVGRRPVIVTNNDSGFGVARTLAAAGIDVAAVIDSRGDSPVDAGGVRIVRSAMPQAAIGRSGVKGLRLDTGEQIDCDAILMAGGWNPVVHLASQAGAALHYDESREAFHPLSAGKTSHCVGAAAGLVDGESGLEPLPAASRGPLPTFVDGDPAAHMAWVDYQNDVTAGDIQLAARENFRSVEHLKRYTTLGMATDQGKTSNVPGLSIMAGLLGKAPQEVGTTRFRPPFDPVTIGAFAGGAVGDNLLPVARLPAHRSHTALGARFEDYGRWLRPAFYPRAGEDEHAAVAREVLAVRKAAGLFDASPLGKIEVTGPDAPTFLDRMYVNTISTLKVGHCRYALMLNENGIVYDDGIVARMAEDRFLVGTTSGHATAIVEAFQEWLQCEWVDLRVLTEDVTSCWAVINVAGPRARDILATLGGTIDLSVEAFPHMTMRIGEIGGVSARVQRVSFSGELSYEISVPSSYGQSLWDALIAAGAEHGIAPFGVEALMTMRIEKGFLHVGSDTDGMTLPQDIGFGGIAAKKQSDFVGRRSTMRPDGLCEDRKQFVGLEAVDGSSLPVGAHVTGATGGSEGWITSSVISPTLGRPVALALVANGRARIGETVALYDMGATSKARIVAPGAYDPKGERLNG